MKTLIDAYYEHGTIVAIIVAILYLGIIFGIMCGLAALLMVCWNFAVVAAIPICAPMTFWVAFVFGLAIYFVRKFCGMLSVNAKNNS